MIDRVSGSKADFGTVNLLRFAGSGTTPASQLHDKGKRRHKPGVAGAPEAFAPARRAAIRPLDRGAR
jgi:hypothetical protein